MDQFQRQQFDFLLQTASERLAERLQERLGSCEAALQVLNARSQPGEVCDFVAAIFRDFLLDNADGACFVLRALARRRLQSALHFGGEETIETALVNLARTQFQALLIDKTSEMLEQHSRYQPVPTARNSEIEVETI